MRLLMLNNEFPPLGGGTGTVNRAILDHFSRVSDLTIDLVTSALGSRREEESFAKNIKIYKVPVRNKNIHHASNRELIEYFFRALRCAFKLHRRHSYNLAFAWSTVPAGGVALALRRISGLRYVVRLCGPDIPGFERRYQSLHRILTPLTRKIWHQAEIIVAKSELEIELVHAVEPQLNCLLIPNGVDTEAFKPKRPDVETGPLRILCVGRLIERKGQHHLIDALKRIADEKIDATLELVGTGDAQPVNEAQVSRLGLTDRVRFLGYVPRESIAERYTAAHVFVLPSFNEGMSVALLEAMASGLALVATPSAATPELIDPEVNGLLFDWSDVECLAAHLRRLARDRSLVQRMGDASRRRAQQFSWDQSALQYIDMLRQVTADIPLTHANLRATANR